MSCAEVIRNGRQPTSYLVRRPLISAWCDTMATARCATPTRRPIERP